MGAQFEIRPSGLDNHFTVLSSMLREKRTRIGAEQQNQSQAVMPPARNEAIAYSPGETERSLNALSLGLNARDLERVHSSLDAERVKKLLAFDEVL